MSEVDEPFLTADELAPVLRLAPDTVRRMARAHELPAHKIGNRWRFLVSEVKAHIAAQDPWRRSPQSRARRASAVRKAAREGRTYS